MKIGIGISSYRRDRWAKNLMDRVIDTVPIKYNEVACVCSFDEPTNITHPYFFTLCGQNMGVAYNKNRLLKWLRDCDVVFLLEDDVEIKKPGWIDIYLNALEDTGKEHLNFLHEHYREDIHHIEEFDRTRIGYGKGRLSGTFMVMTQNCITQLGGFNTRFGRYGYEHVDFTTRAYVKGMCSLNAEHVMGAEEYIGDYGLPSCLTEEEKAPAIEMAKNYFLQPKSLYQDISETRYEIIV